MRALRICVKAFAVAVITALSVATPRAGTAQDIALRPQIVVTDAASGRKLEEKIVVADIRAVRFTIPGDRLDRKCRLAAELFDMSGRTIDTKAAAIFGAPEP